MKRICVVVPSLDGGGAEKVAINLANSFVESGYRVDLLVFMMVGPNIHNIGKSISIFDLKVRRTRYAIWGVVKYLKVKKPDVVISVIRDSNVFLGLALLVTPWFLGKIAYREANTFHGIKNLSWVKRTIFCMLMRIAYLKADIVIANSYDTRDDLVVNKIVSEGKIAVVPNPVVPENVDFMALQATDEPWLDVAGLDVVLGVGRLHEQKDFDLLIDAFSLVYERNKNARLLIIGEGLKRLELLNRIDRLDLAHVVKIADYKLNIFPYFKKSKVFVLTSRWEGFGNVLVEAMSVGTPIISSDCPGGPRMILDNGKYGILISERKATAFAEAIIRTLDGDNAYDAELHIRQAKRYSISSVSRLYIDVIFRK